MGTIKKKKHKLTKNRTKKGKGNEPEKVNARYKLALIIIKALYIIWKIVSHFL